MPLRRLQGSIRLNEDGFVWSKWILLFFGGRPSQHVQRINANRNKPGDKVCRAFLPARHNIFKSLRAAFANRARRSCERYLAPSQLFLQSKVYMIHQIA